jgi:hypothetical protein
MSRYTGPMMDLANMRKPWRPQRGRDVTCACKPEASVNADALLDDVYVREASSW